MFALYCVPISVNAHYSGDKTKPKLFTSFVLTLCVFNPRGDKFIAKCVGLKNKLKQQCS